MEFSPDELSAIDEFAKEGGIDLWREISALQSGWCDEERSSERGWLLR